MKRAAVAIVAFLSLAGVVGFLVRAGGGAFDREGGGAGLEPAAGAPGVVGDTAVIGKVSAGEEAPAFVGGGGSLGDIGVLPAVGPDVIRTADVALLVAEEGFQNAFDQASVIAGKYGGYVQSSSTAGRESRSGTLLIRVPARSFGQAMHDLTQLGEVTRRTESGQDVSSIFVDLEARLRTWQSQEAVLLRLMREARSIEETLRVQRELQDVQFRIEQIKGQLNVLRDQVDLATISVSMRERGAPVPQGPKGDRPDLVEAWGLALNGILGVVFAVIVGLGYLVPIAFVAGAVWIGLRRVRPRVAPAAHP